MPGWATVADLVSWMGLPPTSPSAADPTLQRVLDSVQAYQSVHYHPKMLADAAAAGDQDLIDVTCMRASALYKRRQTPDGISSVGDFAAMRVSSHDPDVKRLESRYWQYGLA